MSQNNTCYIGFDFGTSSSKVVAQLPFYQGSPKFAIDFGKYGSQKNSYLLPTRYSIINNGEILLNHEGEIYASKEKLFYGKYDEIIFGGGYDITAELSAVLYLASAIKIIKMIFPPITKLGNDVSFDYILNLGMPANAFDTEMEAHYLNIGIAAWRLSNSTSININDGKKILYEVKSGIRTIQDTVQVFPEIMAEFLGYLSSATRQNGLKIIVDVGATTLDICGFNLISKNNNDSTRFFTSSISDHGVFKLHQARIEHISKQIFPRNPLDAIPTKFINYIENIDHKSLEDTKMDFFYVALLKIQACLVRLYGETKKNIEWRDGVPIYYCGGGSLHEFYHTTLIREINTNLNRQIPGLNYSLQNIPIPSDFQNVGLNHEHFNRLSVAYGLSHDPREFGELKNAQPINRDPTKKIEEILFDIPDYFPGKEVQ